MMVCSKIPFFSRFFNFERILTEIQVYDGHFLWFDMIEHPFLSIPAKTACPGKVRLIFSKIFRATHLAEFLSGLLPLTIKPSNRFLYNILVSQEVSGMHAVHNNTVVSGMHAVCDSSAGLTGGYCRRACRFPALQFSTSVEVRVLVVGWLVGWLVGP